jgi:hypothetical protein
MTAPRDARRGFALLAVLLLVSMIAMLGATYTRHVTIVSKSSPVAMASQRARTAVDSGVQYARQSLRAGRATSSEAFDVGGAHAALTLADLGGDRSRLLVQSLDQSRVGATALLEVTRAPRLRVDAPDELPRLQASKASALLADGSVPKTWISSSTTLSNADVSGLLIVQDGVTLTLDGVVVSGTIVSARTLTSGLYGAHSAVSAPRVLVAGDLRVTPAAFLRGVALLMPDGELSGSSSASRLQFDGDVVAWSVSLAGSGALRGNLACGVDPVLAAGIERPGAGRARRPLATDLQPGPAWETQLLASLPRVHAPADLPAITGYDFDAP